MVFEKNKLSLDTLGGVGFLNNDNILCVFIQSPWHSKPFFGSRLQFCILSSTYITTYILHFKKPRFSVLWKIPPELNCTGIIANWLQKNNLHPAKIGKYSLFSCMKSCNKYIHGNKVDCSLLLKNDREL